MKTHAYKAGISASIAPNDICLPEKLLDMLGLKDRGNVDVKIDDGKMIISRRKIKYKITKEELNSAIREMMGSMIGNGFTGDIFFVGDLVEYNIDAFLNELDIIVEG